MENPMVSVLMTAYNREKYIAEAIESVLASTYKNFELIIVDDCSKDRTLEIAKSYAEKDIRIKLFLNKKNLGDYPNRNRAAEYAKGKYLKYVDADDLIYPHGLEIIVEIMEKFPNAGWGLMSLPQDDSRPYPFQLSPQEAYRRNYFEHSLFHKAPLSSIICRDVFNEVGGFPEKRYVGDYAMWHILAACYPVVLMPDGIVWHREHGEQEFQIIMMKPLVQFEYHLVSENCILRKEVPLSPQEKKKALFQIKKNEVFFLLRLIFHGKILSAYKCFRKSGLNILQVLFYPFLRID